MKIAAPIWVFCCISFFAFQLLSVTAHGQADINSYAYALQQAESDAQKLTAYENIIKACRFSKPDSAQLLIKKGIAQFNQNGYQQGIASLLTYQGIIYSDQNKTELAEKSLEKSLLIYKAIKDYSDLASGHNILGVLLSRKGKFDDASGHFFKSLKTFEALSDTDGITNTLIKIGENYERSGDLGNALEYYMKGLNVAKDQPENDLVILRSSNIPSVVKDMKDNFISMKKLQKILDVSKNNSYVEVRSLPDAIKDAIYTMDGDTAKTLNYTRYALNLLLKKHTNNLYEGFELSIKDNDKATGNDNTGKGVESVNIASLLKLPNQKQKNEPAVVFNNSNSIFGKTGTSLSLAPELGLLNFNEAISAANNIPAEIRNTDMNSSGYPFGNLQGNQVIKINTEHGSNNYLLPGTQNTVPVPGYGLIAYLPYDEVVPYTSYLYLDKMWPVNFTGWPVITPEAETEKLNTHRNGALISSSLREAEAGNNPALNSSNENKTTTGSAPNTVSGSTAGKQYAFLFNPLYLPEADASVNNLNLFSASSYNHNIEITLDGSASNRATQIANASGTANNGTNAELNNINKLTSPVDLTRESIIKKNEVNSLEVLIKKCIKKGDYVAATSLLEKQKSILDSLVYLESALASTNMESKNKLNAVNSSEPQLEISNGEPQIGNNLPVYIAGILSFVVLAVSISWGRSRLMNKELANREMKLRNSNNVKNKVISVIAHDITGSIGFMPLSLGLCRDKSIPEDEKDALLYQLELNAVSSVKTLQNMLDWAKEQIQGTALNQQHININETLEDELLLINASANQKNISIINNIPGHITAFADPNHIKFVLRNLLSNAVKYSNINGLIGISATLTKNRNQVIISVSDNGTGINKDKIAHIFEPSTKGKAKTDNIMSNGIGLSLCKEFVVENGGEIWVDSEKGRGSVFHFSMKVNS